ncbi:MAG: ABC transporter ATP-binding protein [Chloroflexi bacterium]|nr:ABC transporter ATP-binding protein [Chloroflexota bacterium]
MRNSVSIESELLAANGMLEDSAVLRVEGLSTKLDGKSIVDSVSFSVNRGEVVGVVGANGSGKTTLMRTVAGLLTANSGEIVIDGTSFGHASGGASRQERSRKVAYMPQLAVSHPFTAFESVLMGRYPHLGRFELEGSGDRDLAWQAMERTSTVEFANRKLDTLSGGERQRVVLARVLVQQADVLLMDEPTASLDLRHQILTMDLVREEVRDRNAAVVVILHDLSLAARFCDRLVVLDGGKKLAEGTPWEVLTPSNLRAAFGVEGLVEPDPVTGKPHVLLLGSDNSSKEDLVGTGRTVHLICGAGSGRELMHQLRVAGYDVTVGVLGIGDSDREAAERLGLNYVAAPPFASITDEQHEAHLELVKAADHVVLCAMAVGLNNVRNVVAATAASNLIMIEPLERVGDLELDVATGVPDFTDGIADELRRGMIEKFGEIPESTLLFELARSRGEDL